MKVVPIVLTEFVLLPLLTPTGVRTVMITGDYLKTAIAIAKDVLIIQVRIGLMVRAVGCSNVKHSSSSTACANGSRFD